MNTRRAFLSRAVSAKLFKCGPMQINSLLPELSRPQVRICYLTLFRLAHRDVQTNPSNIIYTCIQALPPATINIIKNTLFILSQNSSTESIIKNQYNVYCMYMLTVDKMVDDLT